MKKILILNGPNLNLLGKREPHIYGSRTFVDYLKTIEAQFPEVQIHYFQSNHEGELIDKIHELGFTIDGIVINAGAYTHTSIAIADALSLQLVAIKIAEALDHLSLVKGKLPPRKDESSDSAD